MTAHLRSGGSPASPFPNTGGGPRLPRGALAGAGAADLDRGAPWPHAQASAGAHAGACRIHGASPAPHPAAPAVVIGTPPLPPARTHAHGDDGAPPRSMRYIKGPVYGYRCIYICGICGPHANGARAAGRAPGIHPMLPPRRLGHTAEQQ